MAAIETEALTKYYGETRGIEDLSLAVEEGEIFGFLGPNGAGKTTTIRTLMGFQSPTSGGATVLGRDVTDESAMVEARREAGYLPSDPAFDEGVTGRRLLDYYASLRGDERSGELLELFSPPLEREIGEYSRGNVQMLGIVVAFMHDPRLVVMDEPTSGLDPLMQERFYAFLREERDRGKTIFFSSHVLSEVRKVCDRVGIIRDGRLVEVEDVRTLLSRGGKRVRVRVAGDVEADRFDLDGAHDVEVTERGVVPELSADGGADEGASSEGTDAGGEAGRGDDRAGGDARTATTVAFTYTGDYNELVSHLAWFDLLDLDVEEAPLEDVFMRFYGAASGGETDA